jgi:DNA-binding MarR family transcriptional regulator
MEEMKATAELVAGIIDNLRRVFQVVNEQSKRAEHETGLTGPQLWAIKIISESAPIRVSDLARKMYLHPATVVGIIDRLESRRLVERTRSTRDRRVVEIALTDLGQQIVVQSPEVAQGLLVKGLEVLSDKTLNNISNGLDQLVKILGAQEIPPQLILSPEVNLPRTRNLININLPLAVFSLLELCQPWQ